MSTFNVTSRYAKAFYSQAESKGLLKEVASDAEDVLKTFENSKELRTFVKNPVLGNEKKLAILSEIFSEKVNKETINFITFITEKGRAFLLFEIFKRLSQIINEKTGYVEVEVSSAVAVSDEQNKMLVARLEKFTEKKVKAKYIINENLIGGFVARIGDILIDASVKNQLKILKKQLLS
ncbi:MAG: ATP synthase F1 subunit delta [Ignavibacteria bacterium]|nr:ATP synthase F1 subunit delta [Ignavibacteria bacterium]